MFVPKEKRYPTFILQNNFLHSPWSQQASKQNSAVVVTLGHDLTTMGTSIRFEFSALLPLVSLPGNSMGMSSQK
jgi:hypothetical protein